MKLERNTYQRMVIKEYLKENKTHPSAYDIYSAVKKKIPTVSFATVYNNLERMVENGELVEINDGERKRFDPDLSEHDHFICLVCGTVYDIEKVVDVSKLEKLSFKIISHTTYVKGVCEKCYKKEVSDGRKNNKDRR